MAAKYPSAIANELDLLIAKNNLFTELNGSLLATGDNTGGLGIAVISTAVFPASGVISINAEVIEYTGISGNKFTGITRGADGTTAAPHSNLEEVSQFIVAKYHKVLSDEIVAIESDLKNAQGVLNDAATLDVSAPTLKSRLDQIVTQLRLLLNPAANWFSTVLINVANGLVRLDGTGKLPSVDGSQLTSLGANSSFRDKETPTGAVNGVNVTFTLAFTPVLGSEHIYKNGVLQLEGYVMAGAVITFDTAPTTTPVPDKIRVSYRK